MMNIHVVAIEMLKLTKIIKELIRKSTNLIAIIIPILCLTFSRKNAISLIGAAAMFIIFIDLLRIYSLRYRRFIYKSFFRHFYRSWERRTLSGGSYILAGSALSILFFSSNIAALSILFAIVGDTFAAFGGRLFGRNKIYSHSNPDGSYRKKTVEGTLSFFVTAFLAGLIIPGVPIFWKLIGAALATCVELVSFFLDDNFTVPIIVGAVLQIGIHGHILLAI